MTALRANGGGDTPAGFDQNDRHPPATVEKPQSDINGANILADALGGM